MQTETTKKIRALLEEATAERAKGPRGDVPLVVTKILTALPMLLDVIESQFHVPGELLETEATDLEYAVTPRPRVSGPIGPAGDGWQLDHDATKLLHAMEGVTLKDAERGMLVWSREKPAAKTILPNDRETEEVRRRLSGGLGHEFGNMTGEEFASAESVHCSRCGQRVKSRAYTYNGPCIPRDPHAEAMSRAPEVQRLTPEQRAECDEALREQRASAQTSRASRLHADAVSAIGLLLHGTPGKVNRAGAEQQLMTALAGLADLAVDPILLRSPSRKALIAAIRRITVEMPGDQPNGPTEQALCDLERALDPKAVTTEWAKLQQARAAAERLSSAMADDDRRLRLAASAFFGGDFAAPDAQPSEAEVDDLVERADRHADKLEAKIREMVQQALAKPSKIPSDANPGPSESEIRESVAKTTARAEKSTWVRLRSVDEDPRGAEARRDKLNDLAKEIERVELMGPGPEAAQAWQKIADRIFWRTSSEPIFYEETLAPLALVAAVDALLSRNVADEALEPLRNARIAYPATLEERAAALVLRWLKGPPMFSIGSAASGSATEDRNVARWRSELYAEVLAFRDELPPGSASTLCSFVLSRLT